MHISDKVTSIGGALANVFVSAAVCAAFGLSIASAFVKSALGSSPIVEDLLCLYALWAAILNSPV